jgi:hypothetical protein
MSNKAGCCDSPAPVGSLGPGKFTPGVSLSTAFVRERSYLLDFAHPAQAANAFVTINLQQFKAISLEAYIVLLTTSAVVGTRYPLIQLGKADGSTVNITSGNGMPASNANLVQWLKGLGYVANGTGWTMNGLPEITIVDPVFITFTWFNAQVGDQLSVGNYQLRVWV